MESNGRIADEQNVFRARRSTSDHIGSLSLTLESRIKMKKDTFAVFIDFSKTYDRINRALLWHKLSILGIKEKILNLIKFLYEHVKCAIGINGTHTEWFYVNSGLKQGCILSPQLFKMFANDLVHAINELNCGLPYSDADHVSILLYDDDIVLLSDDELKMQTMLDCLNKWCRTWGLIINFDKSKAVHFKAVSSARIKFNFVCGNSSLELVDQYKYLRIVFTEHLDLLQMSKIVAQSASRALGLLISKSKALGGMPYECFTKCYDTTVYGKPSGS